ncbi:MAG: pyridoxal phosphate-dependent aminotransferase family protein [Myxococcales bacterium]|nr:pyridoxal phosphate-dependent aminotransferase family protein [Myxococcales bacterium]
MSSDLQAGLESRKTAIQAAGKDIFAKCYDFNVAEGLKANRLYPYFTPFEVNEGPVARLDGQEVVMLGSNNYLGLTTDPRVREAVVKAVHEYGPSMTGSRLLNGTTKYHMEVEEEFADFLGAEACLIFTTGYQANLGVVSALVNVGSVAVVDKADHASVHDGARMADGELRIFPHGKIDKLDRILGLIPEEKGAMVIVDGIFSMEGDIVDLPAVSAVCKKHGARLLVDDAHALGVIGKGGRGTASHFGMEDDVDLIVGTFSKSMASVGGWAVGPKEVLDWVRHFGRSMLFSASLPPTNLAAAHTALKILREEPERVDRLNENASYMREQLRSIGYNTMDSTTPVIPLLIGDDFKTIQYWRALLDAGVYVNPVMYPAVEEGHGLVRTSYMATHERSHLDRALEILEKVGKQFGII